jgi:hypothetical protein
MPVTSAASWRRAETLARFRRRIPPLDLAERERIVDAAIGMRSDYYVHLPQKQASHSVDPVARLRALRRGRRALFPFAALPAGWAEVTSAIPRNFIAASLRTGGTELGYIRIHTFLTEDADAFVAEFAGLRWPGCPRGLILDVRDNGGGVVDAAERCLQLLTPHLATPAPMQLRATLAVLALCQGQGPSNLDRVADLSAWAASVQHALEVGTAYSVALPMTPPEACNALGQRYHGPVVVLTSALSYSATDIFAGGFQDHGIGPVLGVHAATGAGGANVWPLTILQQALGAPQPLPQGAELRVAMRRSLRIGRNAGLELEERGVVPKYVHDLTRRDLLCGGPDMMAAAAKLLLGLPWRQLDVELLGGQGLRVRLRNADRLDTWGNGRPLLSQDVAAGPEGAEVRLAVLGPARVELRAYAGGEVVARRVFDMA